MSPTTLLFFFKIVLVICGSLHTIAYEFRSDFSISVKRGPWGFDREHTKSVCWFGEKSHLNDMESTKPRALDLLILVFNLHPPPPSNVLLLSVNTSFTFVVKFLSNYFLLFDAVASELFSSFHFWIVCC